MKASFRLGVFGAASEYFDPMAEPLAVVVGEYSAKLGLTLVTGATNGLPYIAGKAAIASGGTVLGISPAHNAEEHVNVFKKPLDGSSYIFWTGLGFTGRNFLNVRNCNASIFIGGGAGTLEEFCIAVYESQVIGVLTNSGGITDLIPEIVSRFRNHHGSKFIFDTEPKRLIDHILEVSAAQSKVP
ncbi:MAG TPA: hypothetical protein VNX46_02620 [Candidatus Acidoferrum sp.]|jgi:uncharacterized protein (TIGR00725 family)|nr:hypothetical protein [Candidatus Acidoferrum sp.]